MNETEFVQGLREQCPAAIRHLSECHLPSVWRFVYVRVGGDQHLAEDIVSETVLALMKAAATPEVEIKNPGGWLRTVAGNKVNDHFRAAARVQHLIDQVTQNSETAEQDDPAKVQELKERRADVCSAMDELPDRQRLALEWKYIDKLSVREIAERLDVTEKAAQSILFRARRDFRVRLLRSESDGPTESGHRRSSSNGSGDNAQPDQPTQAPQAHNDEQPTAETRSPVNTSNDTATS